LILNERCLSFADRVGQRRGSQQNLEGRNPPAPLLAEQLLGNDCAQVLGEHDANLLLLVGGEGVDDPVDRLGGGVRMERGENEQPRFGGGHRHADRLEVAHLADEQAVGIFPDRRLDSFGEAGDVGTDLALRKNGTRVDVDELDGVFDRDDVVRETLIDPIQNRRQSRGFAAAGRPGDQHEAARRFGERSDRGRQPQVLHRRDLRGDQAEYGGRASLLAQQVDPKARLVPHLICEVDVSVILEDCPEPFGSDVSNEIVEVPFRQGAESDAFQLAVDPDDRRATDGQMKVRPIALGKNG